MILTIVGASVRSAAQSALRAGLVPAPHDHFGDRDLPSHPIRAVDPALYPMGFEAILAATPMGCPWMYTGALENHPELIDRMARLRPLWGIAGDALRGCRDPVAVARSLGWRGLPAPGVAMSEQGLPRDGTWLVKPRASAGGRRIVPLRHDFAKPSHEVYFQEFIPGVSLAALFVGDGSSARLIGISRQILGGGSNRFGYVGSLGPWPVSPRAETRITAIGHALAHEFGLQGLFGVDLVLSDDDEPFAVEVNPRYTASVEVIELASGLPRLLDHARVFSRFVPEIVRTRTRPPVVVGKVILFAERRSRWPATERLRTDGSRASSFVVPHVADLPAPGHGFESGAPVVTVLARGSTIERCEARLQKRLDRWRSRLVPDPG